MSFDMHQVQCAILVLFGLGFEIQESVMKRIIALIY